MTLKTGITLIIASFIIGIIGALPMIIDRNDSWLLPSLIISKVLLLAGIFVLVKQSSARV